MDISAYFPIQVPGVTLSLVASPTEEADGALRAVVRLTTLDAEGTPQSVKEQPLDLLPAAHRAQPSRLRAYLDAWAAALPTLLSAVDAELMLPSDLFFPEILGDHTLQERADFAEALGDPARWEAVWAQREAHDFRAHLEAHLGSGDPRVAAVEALSARPSIALNIDEDNPDALPLGASRLGGAPDLPPDRAWPLIGGAPLTFLAQIDLAALRESVGEVATALLPSEGWLLFFFGLDGWGDVPAARARGGGRVMHVVAPRRALVRRAPPPGIAALALRSVIPEVEPRPLPNIETPFYALLSPPAPRDADPYEAAWKTFGFLAGELQPSLSADIDRPQDRLLGYADPLQSDPYVLCAVEDAAIPGEQSWERAVLARGAEWTLLFQADSDREAGVFLGDMGVVQFFVRPADLAAGKLDRVRTVWQSC